MPELVVKVPDMLEEDKERIERSVEEFVRVEAKRKMLLEFVDDVMKGAKQLSDEELVKLGGKIKKGRFEKLKAKGLV